MPGTNQDHQRHKKGRKGGSWQGRGGGSLGLLWLPPFSTRVRGFSKMGLKGPGRKGMERKYEPVLQPSPVLGGHSMALCCFPGLP